LTEIERERESLIEWVRVREDVPLSVQQWLGRFTVIEREGKTQPGSVGASDGERQRERETEKARERERLCGGGGGEREK